VTQLPLGSTLADRVQAWADRAPEPFWRLCEAFPTATAGDLDTAARAVGALQWVAGDGVRGRFDVGRKAAEGENL